MSVDDCIHSFFGAKTYADLIVQEYGKNVGLETTCFRAIVSQDLIILGTTTWISSYLVKITLKKI